MYTKCYKNKLSFSNICLTAWSHRLTLLFFSRQWLSDQRHWQREGGGTPSLTLIQHFIGKPTANKYGPSCSKLTMSLVNDSLKFTSIDTQIC